jgi:hypothetical protein
MATEDTMAQLAHSQVTQSLPSLANDVQGFQIIESNDENNSAIGVVVALISNLVVYIPAIFRKGKIYNLDVMYIPELHQWLPTQDNWITYLRSRRTELEASIVDKSQAAEGKPGSVDLDIPLLKIVKTASGEAKDIKYLQRVGIPALLKEAAATMIKELTTEVSDYHIPSTMELLRKCAASDKAMRIVNTVAKYPMVSDAFVQFYDNDEIVDTAATVVKAVAAETPEPKAEGEVKILTSTSRESRELSDEQKALILRDGAIIVDNRGLTPTRMFKAKHNGSWATPSIGGIYELLKLDGSTVTALVIPGKRKPARENLSDGYNYVMPLTDNDAHKMHIAPAHILGQICPTREFNVTGGYGIKNIPTDTLSGASYLIVDIDGNALKIDNLTPMYIGKGDEIVIQPKNKDTMVSRPNATYTFWYNGKPWGDNLDNVRIQQIVGIPAGGKLRIKGTTLFVPEKCRLFPISCNPDYDYENNDLSLATMGEYVDAVSRREKLLAIKVYNGNGKYTISDDTGRFTDPLLKRAAAFDLVKHYAVDPQVAREIIEELKPNSQERYLAKIAADTSYTMSFSNKQESDPNQSTVDLNRVIPEDARNTLAQAAQTGVKEVMDVTVLKMLAEDGSSVRMVQDLVPSLFTAMNAVGQILFMLRASTSMNDAYGDYRADEMEKQFSKLMQRLGDAIIVLQQGRVDEVKDLLEGPLSSTLG